MTKHNSSVKTGEAARWREGYEAARRDAIRVCHARTTVAVLDMPPGLAWEQQARACAAEIEATRPSEMPSRD